MDQLNDYIQYFMPKLEAMVESLRHAAGGTLLTASAVEKIIEGGRGRIRRFTIHYMLDLSAQLVADDNPLARFDLGMLTKEDRSRAFAQILEELESGTRVLPERMNRTVDTVLRNYESFLQYMLEKLDRYRKEICDVLFDGLVYQAVTDLTFAGDTHNCGKSTTIVETDIGKLVFKPHSCAVDAQAYGFMREHFSDCIVIPKVFAYEEEFGVCEFLRKEIARGDEEAAKYYDSLGKAAAVFKMLGSSDMHMENLFAMRDRIALIDIETLLYPKRKEAGRQAVQFLAEEDEKQVINSLLPAAFLNMFYKDKNMEKEFSILLNTDEDGSAPVVAGIRRTVLDYQEAFFAGFSEGYDRCVGKKEILKQEVAGRFSDHVLRVILMATRSYGDVLTRLNSCYSYQSEEYYRSQLDKLAEVLEADKTIKNKAVTKAEILHLMEGEIPFFYTRGNSRDLYADGKLIAQDYYALSACERVTEILDHMNEQEKQFEIHLMQLYFSSTRIKADVRQLIPFTSEDTLLTKEQAAEAAADILNRIYSAALRMESGDLTWLSFDPGRENVYLMDAGLYTGFTGLALFFAAMVQAAADAETAGKARECLDSCMRMVERFLDGVSSLKKEEWKRMVNPGEGSGIGGILKGLVFINRYSFGTYGSLLEKAKDLLLLLDFEDCEETDKAGGIAGLIVTLCRYEEFYKDEKILKLIDRLAQKLASLKTLEYKGGFLWKTLDNKNHPISGAVHGMTGIAEAFLMADLRVGKKRYEKEIQDALEFENCCYREDLGGWPDRRALGSGKMAGGNCYGPIGMRIIMRIWGVWEFVIS